MTKVNESFSAFLDDEATELDIQRMLNAIEDDPSVVNHWHDLSKTQAVMQEMPVLAKAATLTIKTSESSELAQSKPWYGRLLQGGIAAVVAVLTVTSMHFMTSSENQATDTLPTVAVQSQTLEQVQLLTQQQYEAQQQLNIFLREHAEQAAFTTGHVVTTSPLEWVEPE